MTRERAVEIAKSILKSRGWNHGDATPEEVKEITAIWETLPGHYSFYDAVRHIAEQMPEGKD